MDDDEEEREFSKSIVYDFFQQAESTFSKMDGYLYLLPSLQLQLLKMPALANLLPPFSPYSQSKDLHNLSQQGHFLKGSSATLGLTKVKDSCEKLQNFGAKKDETGTRDEPDTEKCLENCRKAIKEAKEQFSTAEVVLRRFYHDEGS